jgi:tetratricopeptide (TPR) repeat protein
MRESDFMLTAEERLLKRRRRRRILVIVLSCLVLLAVVLLSIRPVTSATTTWQAHRHAQKAYAYMEKENWTEAHKEANAAYQLRPKDPQALRVVAHFLSQTRQIDALDFWKQLSEKNHLTRQDLRDEATIAIIAGDRERAEAAVSTLLAKNAEPADWLLAAQLSMQKNLRDEAKSYLQKIVADPRTNESQQLRATLLQLAFAEDNQSEQTNALARLKKLAEGKTETSLDALVVLAQNALSVPVESSDSAAAHDAINLSQALENHPLAKAQHKLLALDLLAHVDPAHRDAIIARAISTWKDAAPEDLAALADWLNGKREFEKTLDTIPSDKAIQSRDLFVRYLDALGALGRWDQVKEQLESQRFLLDPVAQTMYLARCNSQLGEETAAENNWRRALETAGTDVSKLMMLADYAEKNGNTQIAGAAYDNVVAISPRLRIAQDGRLRLAQARRDTQKMHAVLAEMLALWPNDPAIQNDEAYTRLLLLPDKAEESAQSRDAAAVIEQLAQKLVEREPASLPHRTLLALARLRQGRAAEALQVYENINVPARVLTPSALAVHAAILAATDHSEDARTEKAQVPFDKLLPQERALIETAPRSE